MPRIKQLRLEYCYTQMQMTEKTGIDQSNYSKIELGIRSLSLEQAIVIAKVFDTSIDYIIGLTNERKHYPRRKKFSIIS